MPGDGTIKGNWAMVQLTVKIDQQELAILQIGKKSLRVPFTAWRPRKIVNPLSIPGEQTITGNWAMVLLPRYELLWRKQGPSSFWEFNTLIPSCVGRVCLVFNKLVMARNAINKLLQKS